MTTPTSTKAEIDQTLPELPKPCLINGFHMRDCALEDGYRADQMRAYATQHATEAIAAERAEVERLRAECEKLRAALVEIYQMTNPDEPDNYRSDDSEGCLDTVFSIADAALATPTKG